MQSFPRCGAISNPSSTWTWLVVSSLLGTSGFPKQLCVLLETWTLHTPFLSNLGSGTCDSVPHWQIQFLSLRGGESPMILVGFSGTCGAWHLLHLRVGCCLRPRASTRLCAGGPPRALGRAQQASGPTGQSAESKTKFSRKAVGNAADEVAAWH